MTTIYLLILYLHFYKHLNSLLNEQFRYSKITNVFKNIIIKIRNILLHTIMTFTNLSLIVQGIDIFYSLLTIAYASNRKINFNGDFIAGPRIISTLLRYPKLLFNLSTKTTVRTIHSKITKKAVFLRIFYRNSNECVRNPCSRVVGNHPQPFPAP